MLDKSTMEFLSKPALAGLVAGLASRFTSSNDLAGEDIVLGISTAIGVLGGEVLGKYVIPNNEGRTLETRVLQTSLSVGTVLAIDSYVMGVPVASNGGVFRKTALVVFGEMGGDYLSDMLYNKSVV